MSEFKALSGRTDPTGTPNPKAGGRHFVQPYVREWIDVSGPGSAQASGSSSRFHARTQIHE